MLCIILLCSKDIWGVKSKFSKTLIYIIYILILSIFIFFCIASRKHYTVDIITGIVAALSLYGVYRDSWIPSHILYREKPRIQVYYKFINIDIKKRK